MENLELEVENIKLLNGKPLLLHVIDNLIGLDQLKGIAVSTDSAEIEDLCKNINEVVTLKLRDKKLADDYTVDYAPGGSYDAPSMRESYQLGGLIPGQPGFGERLTGNNPNVLEDTIGTKLPSVVPRLKKGGKVKY